MCCDWRMPHKSTRAIESLDRTTAGSWLCARRYQRRGMCTPVPCSWQWEAVAQFE
jgi:hypothetical protein